MIPMSLQQAAKYTNGILADFQSNKAIQFSNIATDTRQTMEHSLFIALKGDNFNAHEFIDQAVAQGAVACMVDEDVETTIPSIQVTDCVKAMGQLAAGVRQQFSIPYVGITGSSGKTTVKEMLASVLAYKGQVLATKGNFNNAIGVPLTLFRLTAEDDYAVIEMGASKAGDIDEIAQLVMSDVALITNVSAAHLQGLGTIEGVANVKGEILDYLQEDGVAILEQDSPWLARWANQLSDSQTLKTFSTGNPAADYYASDITLSPLGLASFIAHTPTGKIDITLSIAGMHNVNNALATMAAAVAAGASLSDCQKGLSEVNAVSGRLQILSGIGGCRIIDDSYNANPSSLFAAMDLLKDFPGKRLLVLGDMAELGEEAESAHLVAGQQAKAMGLDGLYATGSLSRHAIDGFGQGAHHFETKELLADALRNKLLTGKQDDWNLLIKGSRSAAMEELVVNLQQEQTGTQSCY